LNYDAVFEPVVMGHRMFLGFNDSDKVLALDMRTGEVLWTFYSDGPVRFSPVVADGRVYFTSDDGYLYCVDAENGNPRWKLRGGPSAQKVLGNQRIISAWPARGGPVLRDNTIYFAASIWPFMGTFVYAVGAETGKVKWLNDSTGADYIKQPHDAPAFVGVAPQGQLAATEKLLLVPGGRSLPAVFDRATGRLPYFGFGAKGMGGSFVAADQWLMFVHARRRGTAARSPMRFLPLWWHRNDRLLPEPSPRTCPPISGQIAATRYPLEALSIGPTFGPLRHHGKRRMPCSDGSSADRRCDGHPCRLSWLRAATGWTDSAGWA